MTPKSIDRHSAPLDDITMSPAYKTLLADVKSLRESLKVAESELHVLAQKTPEKSKVAVESDAVVVAEADVRAQKVASEVARIEARLERVKKREQSFLEKIEGAGDVGKRAKRQKHSEEKRKKKKKSQRQKKKSRGENETERRQESNKSSRVVAELESRSSSPVSASKYRSERATQSIARAVAAVEFASSQHAADAYKMYAATGSASKPQRHLKPLGNVRGVHETTHLDLGPCIDCAMMQFLLHHLRFRSHGCSMIISDTNTESIVGKICYTR